MKNSLLLVLIFCVSLGYAQLPDVSFSEAWNTSGIALIEEGTLSLEGNTDGTAKAELSIPIGSLSNFFNLYFIGETLLENIEVGVYQWQAPKFRVSALNIAGAKKTLDVNNISEPIENMWILTGVKVSNFPAKINSIQNADNDIDSVSHILLEIIIQNSTGKMSVRTPALRNSTPSSDVDFPFELPADPSSRIEILTSELQPFNDHLISINNPFINDPRDWSWSTPQMRELILQRLPASNLRFPGGTVSNYYNWETDQFYDDTCTAEQLGYQNAINNGYTFGFEGFASLSQELGANSILSFNVMQDDIPKSQARLLDRLQRDMTIDWIEMGNENYFPQQACGQVETPEQYRAFTQSLSEGLKAIEPTIKTAINIDGEGFGAGGWNERLARDPYYDGTALHIYTHSGSFIINAYSIRNYLRGYKMVMKDFENYEAMFGDIPMIVTEWGVLRDKIVNMSYAEALISSDMFLALIEGQQRGIVHQASLHTPALRLLYRPIGNDLGMTHLGAIYEKIFEVFKGNQIYSTNSVSPELESELAAVNMKAIFDGDSIRIFVVNKLPEASPLTISVDGVEFSGDWRMEYIQEPLDSEIIYELDANPWKSIAGNGLPEIPSYAVAVVGLSIDDMNTSREPVLPDPIQIYPNPTKGVLNLEVPVENKYEIYIRNHSGALIKHEHIIRKHTQVDLSAYPTGLYLVELRNKDKRQIFKVLKM